MTLLTSQQVLNLAHSLRGIDQVVALAAALPRLPDVAALVLGR
jgi:hypothetical protein